MFDKEVKIEDSWKKVLLGEFKKPYFKALSSFVHGEYLKGGVETYPAKQNIFRAFNLCSFENVKVVIIGQDPYHGPNQANGLCFSVNDGVTPPPSLKNIYKEIENDLHIVPQKSGDLSRWAKQGVLLLNATLTVGSHAPGSHQKKGWEEFTDFVIEKLSSEREGLVFILWGNYAKKKGKKIDTKKHLVLEAAHPSPFSVYKGFFGTKHFSKTNKYLKKRGVREIDWK
ncbi:MAG: uracil-DNA glycosylase [bacterium]